MVAGLGNWNAAVPPGFFVSTFGNDTGMALACGESRWEGDGAREFSALSEGTESSRKGRTSSCCFTWGTLLEELRIVVRAGRDISLISVFDAVGGLAGIGICSTISLELLPEEDTEIGGGFCFLLSTVSDESDDSSETLLVLLGGCARGGCDFVLDSVLARTSSYGVSPRCNLASTSLSVT
jgi:hypothetical protein